jgi:hypothetical protein
MKKIPNPEVTIALNTLRNFTRCRSGLVEREKILTAEEQLVLAAMELETALSITLSLRSIDERVAQFARNQIAQTVEVVKDVDHRRELLNLKVRIDRLLDMIPVTAEPVVEIGGDESFALTA